jgi:hypothetical protein
MTMISGPSELRALEEQRYGAKLSTDLLTLDRLLHDDL